VKSMSSGRNRYLNRAIRAEVKQKRPSANTEGILAKVRERDREKVRQRPTTTRSLDSWRVLVKQERECASHRA
jgi:hypothetical protein